MNQDISPNPSTVAQPFGKASGFRHVFHGPSDTGNIGPTAQCIRTTPTANMPTPTDAAWANVPHKRQLVGQLLYQPI